MGGPCSTHVRYEKLMRNRLLCEMNLAAALSQK